MMSRKLRHLTAAVSLAALGPLVFAATPIAAQPRAPQPQSGAGFGDKLVCAGCIAGGLVAIAGGGGLVIAILSSPGGQLALAVCVEACVEAYAE